MGKMTFTKAQRDRAKKDGGKLCAVVTPHVSFDGPCTDAEHEEIVRFLQGFITRRYEQRKAERLALEATQTATTKRDDT